MTKRTKKLEKDGAQWKVKWENANRALIEMADEVCVSCLCDKCQFLLWLKMLDGRPELRQLRSTMNYLGITYFAYNTRLLLFSSTHEGINCFWK